MQEQIRKLARTPAAAALIAGWPARSDTIIEEALALQTIPAPTFEEAARAAAVQARMQAIGLADVTQDAVGNVIARTPGSRPGLPGVLISAHLDTVFAAGTDLTVTRSPARGRIQGPGLGDNSLGLAALLALAGALQEAGEPPPADIWWLATVGEEGLGDLRGMRHAVQRLGDRIGLALVLEGIGLGWVYHVGLGVRRLQITVRGPGGHAWMHPPPPSAIHHLLRLGAALVELITVPDEPRSTLNIGLIEGGTSINTRAPQASLSLDLRSVDAATLRGLEDQVRGIVDNFSAAPGLSCELNVIGDRPSAALPVDHPLVQAAVSVLTLIGHQPVLSTGSTDANALLAEGIPAITIGITTGGSPHTLDEYIETGPLAAGMTQLTLLALLAASRVDEWRRWQPG